jgi:hypothetical protein
VDKQGSAQACLNEEAFGVAAVSLSLHFIEGEMPQIAIEMPQIESEKL